jgi:hypothetical protein
MDARDGVEARACAIVCLDARNVQIDQLARRQPAFPHRGVNLSDSRLHDIEARCLAARGRRNKEKKHENTETWHEASLPFWFIAVSNG